jgi:hypothetical protein
MIKDNSALTLPLTYTADEISPTPLSTVPTPSWRKGFRTDSSGVSQNASFAVRPTTTALVIMTIGVRGGADVATLGTTTVTVTPNVGTPITATLVASNLNASAVGTAIYQALLLSDANSATELAVNWTCTNTPFGGNDINVWTIPSGSLSSTTATDSQVASASSANAASVNLNVSAGGFIIAGGTSQVAAGGTGTLSGDEAFATRFIDTAAGSTLAAGDASGCSADATSTVTVTFTGAASTVNIAAASWR